MLKEVKFNSKGARLVIKKQFKYKINPILDKILLKHLDLPGVDTMPNQEYSLSSLINFPSSGLQFKEILIYGIFFLLGIGLSILLILTLVKKMKIQSEDQDPRDYHSLSMAVGKRRSILEKDVDRNEIPEI